MNIDELLWGAKRWWEEIEFVCANSDFHKPKEFKEILRKHIRLYSLLKGTKGLLAYRQDYSTRHNKTYSFAVIVLDKNLKSFVLKKASEIQLPVDLINRVGKNAIYDAFYRNVECQI